VGKNIPLFHLFFDRAEKKRRKIRGQEGGREYRGKRERGVGEGSREEGT